MDIDENQCPFCCKAYFSSREKLREHLIQVSCQLRKLQCRRCNDTFLTLDDLIVHLKEDCLDENGDVKAQERFITYIDCSGMFRPQGGGKGVKLIKWHPLCPTDENKAEVPQTIGHSSQTHEEPIFPAQIGVSTVTTDFLESSWQSQKKPSKKAKSGILKKAPLKIPEPPGDDSKLLEFATLIDSETILQDPFLESDQVDEIDHSEIVFESAEINSLLDSESEAEGGVGSSIKKESPAKAQIDKKLIEPKKGATKSPSKKQDGKEKQSPDEKKTKNKGFGKPKPVLLYAKTTIDPLDSDMAQHVSELLEGKDAQKVIENYDAEKFTCVKCSYCSLVFTTIEEFKVHTCSLSCNECPCSFKTRAGIYQHLRGHERNNMEKELNKNITTTGFMFHCKECKLDIPVNCQAIHTEIHKKKMVIIKCELCDYLALSVKGLARHNAAEHESQNPYPCNKCIGRFPTQELLDAHMTVHKITLHECRFCGKTWNRKIEQIKHERVHTGEKPYSCELCGRSFRVSSSLTVHKRTHTNERPYPCSLCEKSFKAHSALMFHLRTHSDVRKYQCDICQKTFKTVHTLHGHKRTHKKEFKCLHCSRAFVSQSVLDQHCAKMHAAERSELYVCVICGAAYGRAYSLETHLKTHGELGKSDDTEVVKALANLGYKKMSETVPNAIKEVVISTPRSTPKKALKKKIKVSL